MNDEILIIYEKYSKINPYNNHGLMEKACKLKRSNTKDKNKVSYTVYWFVPKELSDYNEDRWISRIKLIKHLKDGITFQIYFDLVCLGINSPNNRPKCEFCGKEASFSDKKGYLPYCDNHRRTYVGVINSLHFKGKPLTEETKRKLSISHTGKIRSKEALEKFKRTMAGRDRTLSKEAREKISKSKKGKVQSRSYYKSGIYNSNKCEHEINYLSSYEKDFLAICDYSKQVLSIKIPDPIEYYYAGGNHNYYPDFLITIDSGEKVLVEVKAFNMLKDPKVLAKKLAAKKWGYKNKIKYIIITEKDIYIKGKKKVLNRFFNIYDYI